MGGNPRFSACSGIQAKGSDRSGEIGSRTVLLNSVLLSWPMVSACGISQYPKSATLRWLCYGDKFLQTPCSCTISHCTKSVPPL